MSKYEENLEDEEVKETKETKAETKVIPVKSWCPKQLFVSGLPYTANEEELKEFFKDFKEAIMEIKMPKY